MTNEPLLPNKKLGQHWLKDEAVLRTIVEAADIGRSDVVLEIGPGQGDLTKQLTVSARQVIAVELDQQLVRQLEASEVPNLQVVSRDILKFDFTSLPPNYKVVANIPYYLTSNLLRVLSETANPPVLAALLVQKEVAERLAAGPGSMSILAVTTQFYWQVSLGLVVRANLFIPPPKVDSQLVLLRRRSEPLFAHVNTKRFFQLVRVGFAQKRKTLLNNLANLVGSREVATKLLDKAGIEPNTRAQVLSMEQWHKLYRLLDDSLTR